MSVQTYIVQHHESQKVVQNVCYSGASALTGIFMTGAHWLVGADVKIRSSIWVGAYVKPVVLARVLLLLIMYNVYDHTAPDRLMMGVTARHCVGRPRFSICGRPKQRAGRSNPDEM